jgi:5-methylcytosine-specific restriction endonuclease McrA
MVKRDRTDKRERRAERKRIQREAKKLLTERFKVPAGFVGGYHGIYKYIRHYAPKTTGDGYALLYNFVGEAQATPSKRPHRFPKKIAPVITIPIALKDDFLQSYEWRRVRMEALKKYGTRCQCCGATPADGVKMNVDHIKPRKLFPQLALDISNLQVLCEVCNHGKGNWDMTDWRQKDGISSQPESVG